VRRMRRLGWSSERGSVLCAGDFDTLLVPGHCCCLPTYKVKIYLCLIAASRSPPTHQRVAVAYCDAHKEKAHDKSFCATSNVVLR